MDDSYEDDGFEDEDDILADPEDDVADEDVNITRMITVAPVDLEPIDKAMENLPSSSPIARGLIFDIQEMHQLLGDADAYLADKLRDVESGVRLLFSEFYKQPAATLLGVLSHLDPPEQLDQIAIIEQLLISRKNRIEAQLGGQG